MSYNYKSLWGQIGFRKKLQSKDGDTHAVPIQQGRSSSLQLFCSAAMFALFGVTSMNAQTTLIDPATVGGFNQGSTFESNGWTVANEGTGPIKWAVGTAVNAVPIAGNSAYITADEGLNNTYAGVGLAKTVFFYRDVTLPAGQTNIALSFNWRSGISNWQVFVAPTSVTPVGGDAALSFSGFPSVATLAGATPVVLGVTNATTVQKATGFIPAGFAGQTVRLIFMWSNGTGGGTNPPLAIDNISLVSRVGGQQITSIATGNFSDATTWDKGYAPSPSDDAIVVAGHAITLDNKNLGVRNLYLAGAGATVQFGTDTDEFTVNNDLSISGTGSKFTVFNGTSGRSLKVAGNIDLFDSGRLDVSVGNTNAGAGQLVLFGSNLQTITADGAANFGGTTVATTSSNTAGIINQLIINNTSTLPSNITWSANNVRIKGQLQLNKARVALGTNRIILGNYAALGATALVAPFGSGFNGGTVSRWYAASATGTAVVPGTDHNPNTTGFYPILSSNGQNRSSYLISAGTAATAGELDVTYTDDTTITTGLSIADGSYTVTDRYNGRWAVAAANGYTNTAGTFTFGTYANGAFEAKDGSLRIINNSALVPTGQHINGTTTPFVSRKGMTLADLTANPLYIGFNSASVLGAATKTSVANGDWNTAATWTPSGVPTGTDIVKIAHAVTNNAAASAASITINAGASLVNASNALTVGVTNNNAIFANYGTLTVSGGTVTVNGALSHKTGSTFNQTGGDIIIDSNAAGVAANSVGIGGSSLKIENSSLNLTNGTITIVDPLINNSVATTATPSAATLTVSTFGTTGSFNAATSAASASGTSSISVSNFNSTPFIYGVGQLISGTGIDAGTTIASIVPAPTTNGSHILNLSKPLTANLAAGATVTFSCMNEGSTVINLAATGNFSKLAVGQVVSGTGIPVNTTILGLGSDFNGNGGIKLSNAILGLGSPITTPQTITFTSVSENCSTIILSAANPLIAVGQPVGGSGIQPGTTVTAISTDKLDLSLPTIAGITTSSTLSFYDGNPGSCAVAYNSPNHYAAGMNHTLQIGDGISTENAPAVTNGYLCNFAQGGGLLSLGKLTVNALDGASRFFNTINSLNVQGDFTVTSGSVFKRTLNTGGLYLGGNIINNGKVFMHPSTQLKLMNFINGAEVATATSQTISGGGFFYNDLAANTATGSVPQLTVNNTSTGGLTIAVPDFRVANTSSSTISMVAGIIHTTAANPLYHGPATLGTTGASITGFFSDTCFIDGPYSKGIPTNSTNTTFVLYPVGKTTYKPLSLAVTGGGDFKVEAFNTNTGTATANIANLGTTRWTATRNGTQGALTDFRVALGSDAIASNNIIVQAPADQGTYDVLGTSVFAAGIPNTGIVPTNSIITVNNISMPTAIAGTSFTGNFAYATAPNCTTVNPGNTIADLTTSVIVHTQAVYRTNPGNGITAGSTTVTLAAAANPLIVPGLYVTAGTFTGIPAGTTVVSVSGSTIVLSQAPTASNGTTAVTLTFTSVKTPLKLSTPQEVKLSLQNPAVGNGVTYQWQSSSTGSTYTDIDGATSATYAAYVEASTYFRAVVTCPNGPVTANSTPVFVEFLNSTEVTGGAGCLGSAITLTASSSAATWYDSLTGGASLATGTTYAPMPTETTTYYVSNDGSAYTAGRSFTGTAAGTANYTGIIFNTTTKIRLNSVKVHPKQTTGNDPQPITIKLYDKNNVQVPGTEAVTFTPTANTAFSTTVFDVVTLNYEIPVGTGFKLLAISGMSANNALGVFNNGGLAGALPVGAGSIAITSGASSLVSLDANSYNNFFDLSVTDVTPRVPVTATVISTPAPTAAPAQAACATGTIADFTVTGESGATFTWYSDATANTVVPTDTPAVLNTIYYVSQTANTCESPRTAVTASGVKPAAPTGLSEQDSCETGTIADFKVTGADGATFTWYDSATLGTSIPTTTTAVLNMTYYVSQTVNGCEGPRLAVKATGTCLGTADFKIAELKYYPNPVTDQLTITAKDAVTKVEVYNLLGQQLKVVDTNTDNVQINFNNFSPSTYLVKVYSQDKVQFFKVIKK